MIISVGEGVDNGEALCASNDYANWSQHGCQLGGSPKIQNRNYHLTLKCPLYHTLKEN